MAIVTYHGTEDDLATVTGMAATYQVVYDGSRYVILKPAAFPWLDSKEVGSSENYDAAIKTARELAETLNA